MVILLKKIVENQAKSSTFSVWISEIGLFIEVYKGNITFAFGQYLAPEVETRRWIQLSSSSVFQTYLISVIPQHS